MRHLLGRTPVPTAVRDELDAERGRWLGYMFGAAALVSAGTLVLPHTPNYDTGGIYAVTALAIVATVVLLVWHPSLPGWGVHVALVVAAVLTGAYIGFTDGLPNAASLFFVWMMLFAFYYLPPWQAIGHLLFVLAVYVYSALNSDTGYSLAANTVGTIGALAGAGALVAALRRRLERAMTALVESARTDELTGLPNRRAFVEDLARTLARAERSAASVGLLALDLDYFKRVNDTHGHAAGDRVLVRLAEVLRREIRAGDEAARVGGEEFAVVLAATEPEHALQMEERVRRAVEAAFADDDPPVTASLGVASWTPGDAHDGPELVRLADEALYAAKAAGRNRVVADSVRLHQSM